MNLVQESTRWDDVRATIARHERSGSIGVAIIAPDGERWSQNGQRQFRAASVVKIPLMVELYRAIDRGELSLDETFDLTSADKAPGSGVLLHMHNGVQVTLNDLIYLMISISDNTATNMLIDVAGMQRVNKTMRELGMSGSNLGRKMRGRPAVEGEQENLATPDDYAVAVSTILDKQAASADSCDAMLAMLRKQQDSSRIARHLPDDGRVAWGSKTGSIAGVTNDVGFITTPAGTLVVAVFCEDLPDQLSGEEAIGDIARAAMNATSLLDGLAI